MSAKGVAKGWEALTTSIRRVWILEKCEHRARARSSDNDPEPAALHSALVNAGYDSVRERLR